MLERLGAHRFRRRPDEQPAAAQTEQPTPVPTSQDDLGHDAEGHMGEGVYAIDFIIDVERPGPVGRLSVLLQYKGNDPDTGLPWEPYWTPISRILSSEVRAEARQMEKVKYADAVASAGARTLSSTRLTHAEQDALRLITAGVRRHLDRVTILAGRHPLEEGPSALIQGVTPKFVVKRGHAWAVVPVTDLADAVERRRCRAACRVNGLSSQASLI